MGKLSGIIIGALFAAATVPLAGEAWRSSLYPEDWEPGYMDHNGNFLHDFSYAGYHRGEVAIPDTPPGAVYDVTAPPYNADNSGSSDATAAIQQAIDDAGDAGGGIVYLPSGTYSVSPVGDRCLRVSQNGVVIRGAGAGQTFLLNTETYMRYTDVIRFTPASGDWYSPLPGTEIAAASDFAAPGHQIHLATTAGLSVGDTIMLRSDSTLEFGNDVSMGDKWLGLPGLVFCRRITAVDEIANVVTIDIPTRFVQKMRDNARIYKVADHLEECGLEDLSLGMIENPGWQFGAGDYGTPGTGAYEVNRNILVHMKHVRNCWIQRVETFRPAANTEDYHILSNGIEIEKSAHVTVRECVMEKPQYEGGGGNGYGYTLVGGDCLLVDNIAHHCRHNYDFKSMSTSGNAVVRCKGIKAYLLSDFHMHFTVANLFDSMDLDNDALDAQYRPFSDPEHGHPTTESVFWNTKRDGYGTVKDSNGNLCDGAVYSGQWGKGYVIGTHGEYPKIYLPDRNNSEPTDFAEGEGAGQWLRPRSLYEDQRTRRLGTKVITRAATALDSLNGTAMLNLSVVSTGKEAGMVGIYWGTSDGGTTMWENCKPLDVLPTGDYAVALENLSTNETYWCRAFSSNTYGMAWADETVAFSLMEQKPALYEDYFDGDLSQWVIEQEPGGEVSIVDGKLDIDAAAGCTVWFKPQLHGAVQIDFQTVMMDTGGPYDHVSDLHCFWMASDPASPDNIFVDSSRGGEAADYNLLRLYAVGFGEDANSATRFRRYAGDGTTPLLPEHDLNDPQYLLPANETVRIRLTAEDGRIRCYRDSLTVFDFTDAHPYEEGWFAFRTENSHFRIENFKVTRLPGRPFVKAGEAAVSAASAEADLTASLLAGETADLTFVWDAVERGTNISAWAQSQTVTDVPEGPAVVTAAGLSARQGYVFRCMASNAYGIAWSSPVSFTTEVSIEQVVVADDFSLPGDFTAAVLAPDIGPPGVSWEGHKTSWTGTILSEVTSAGNARFGAAWATGRGGSAALAIDPSEWTSLKIEADLVDMDFGTCAFMGFSAPEALNNSISTVWDMVTPDALYLAFDLDDPSGTGALRHAGLWLGDTELVDFTGSAYIGNTDVGEYEGHRWSLWVDILRNTAEVLRDEVVVVKNLPLGIGFDVEASLDSVVLSGMYNDWDASNRYVDFDNLTVTAGLPVPGPVDIVLQFAGDSVNIAMDGLASYTTNILQYCTDLGDGVWNDLADVSGGGTTNWTHGAVSNSCFYRVLIRW